MTNACFFTLSNDNSSKIFILTDEMLQNINEARKGTLINIQCMIFLTVVYIFCIKLKLSFEELSYKGTMLN